MTGALAFCQEENNVEERRKDPYEVLGISCYASDQEIKSAYCKMSLKYVICLMGSPKSSLVFYFFKWSFL